LDVSAVFGPLATAALDAIETIVPLAIPVLVALVAITIALRVFGMFGVKR
jgi:hypothetical protein